MLYILPVVAIIAVACAIVLSQRRASVRERTVAVEKIDAFHAESQDEACGTRLTFDRGEIDPDYFAVHDPETGRCLAMTRSGNRLGGKWWVLYEEYMPGGGTHPADRLARHEAIIPGRHPSAAKLRSFVELARKAEPPRKPDPVERQVDPFEMPSDPAAPA